MYLRGIRGVESIEHPSVVCMVAVMTICVLQRRS